MFDVLDYHFSGSYYVRMYVCCISNAPYVMIGCPTMNRRCGRRTDYIQSTLANKCVFNFFLKQTVVSIFLMLSGSVFHTPSDARVKDLPAKADRSPLGLESSLCPSDLKERAGLYSLMRLWRYTG